MHQPLIPAGGHDLRTAEIISNLKYMLDFREIGDNHNAPRFLECCKRMGEFIPQLIHEGKEPRVMLEYSGTLLYGLAKRGQDLSPMSRCGWAKGTLRALSASGPRRPASLKG